MFPYCCLLIICIMLFPCSVFKVHLSYIRSKKASDISKNFVQRIYVKRSFSSHSELVGQSGLEPPTSRLSVVCSSQLSYWPVFGSFGLFVWWRLAGSNR